MPTHYPCRVRAGTACWEFGPHTTLCRVHAGTDTKPIIPCRVRVVFLVSCPVPQHRAGPFGHLKAQVVKAGSMGVQMTGQGPAADLVDGVSTSRSPRLARAKGLCDVDASSPSRSY